MCVRTRNLDMIAGMRRAAAERESIELSYSRAQRRRHAGSARRSARTRGPPLVRCLRPYAATIHKSQRSEYLAVVIPVMTQHYPMLQRNLLYTGVTRGKKLVVLVGQTKAIAIAVRNVSGRRRWSKLKEWLVPGAKS
jgi:hypothetical protein